MSGCMNCGAELMPCTEPACVVRCLHDRPDPPSPLMHCTGVKHANGWHLCRLGKGHQIATAAGQAVQYCEDPECRVCGKPKRPWGRATSL